MLRDGERADIVFLNGKVVTVDASDRIAEAVAVRDGKIVRVGSNSKVKELVREGTKVIDLTGKTLLPGFIDSHTHLVDAALSLRYLVDGRTPPNKSISDILEKIKERSKETSKGEWIIVQGSMFWDRKLAEKRYPNKEELDEAAPDHPVVVWASAHVSIVNSKALKVAGITKDTPDPPGGKIEKDETGEPTGVLRECFALLPLPSYAHEQIKETVKMGAQKWWVQQGITTVHCFCGSYAMRIYQELLEEDELPLRIHLVVYTEDPRIGLESLINLGICAVFGNEKLKLGGLKIFVDGAFMGLSAATYEPYVGMPNYCGLLQLTPKELTEIAIKANREGIRLCIHAIGDKAQDMALDAIEEALRAVPKRDHRHRIEHLGNVLTSKERIKRAKRLGVIPVPTVEWIHAYGDFIEEFLGPERAKQSFPIKTLFDEGLRPPGCSDTLGTEPLSINPFFSIWCAVTRKTFAGNKLIPEEGISVMDGIRMYTINGAYAGFEENVKGSIEPGKLADMIVISDDILTVPADKIKDIRVDMTMIDGKIIYQK